MFSDWRNDVIFEKVYKYHNLWLIYSSKTTGTGVQVHFDSYEFKYPYSMPLNTKIKMQSKIYMLSGLFLPCLDRTNTYGTFLSSHNRGRWSRISRGSASAAKTIISDKPRLRVFVAKIIQQNIIVPNDSNTLMLNKIYWAKSAHWCSG